VAMPEHTFPAWPVDLQLPSVDVRPTEVPDQADPFARAEANAGAALPAQFPRRSRRGRAQQSQPS
jgi:hypothetical protein